MPLEPEARVLGYPGERARTAFALGAAEPGAALPERVLAYGANATPAVLAAKLPGLPVRGEPVVVTGVDVVFSRHVAPYGAVPATVVAAPGTTVEALVLHLDAPGLEALAATESNYTLEVLATEPPVRAFVSRHGPRAPLTALAAVPATGRPPGLPARTEAEVLEELRARVAPELDLTAFVARLARDAAFRHTVARAL